jgi:signal transduction histidine kinase
MMTTLAERDALISEQAALERLVEAVRNLAAARSLGDVVDIVRHAARDLVGADGATFVLRDDGRCYYVDEDAIAPLWSGRRFPMEACISGWAMLHAEQVVIADIYLDERIPQEAYRPTFVRSLAMTPIRTVDPLGAIGVYWAQPRRANAAECHLLQALADSTAVAMENVRVLGELEQRRATEAGKREAWLQACLQITGALLDGPVADPLPVIAEQARRMVEADTAHVLLLDAERDELVAAVASGTLAIARTGERYPREQTYSGIAVATGRPVVVADARCDNRAAVTRRFVADTVGPVLVVPMLVGDRPLGTLVMTRRAGRAGFGAVDLDQVSAFANYAAIAVEFADARRAREELSVREERDRIARDLHDDVIQRLFAAGMSLQNLHASLGDNPGAERLDRSIADIDRTISGIRGIIYRMRTPLDGVPCNLRDRVLEVLGEVSPLFDRAPALHFEGPLDILLDREVTDDVVAVLRETLTNVAKHAGASHTEVELAVDAGERLLRVEVTDDGVGLGNPARHSGTANVAARAMARGGSCSFESPVANGRGTRVQWSVPLS